MSDEPETIRIITGTGPSDPLQQMSALILHVNDFAEAWIKAKGDPERLKNIGDRLIASYWRYTKNDLSHPYYDNLEKQLEKQRRKRERDEKKGRRS